MNEEKNNLDKSLSRRKSKQYLINKQFQFKQVGWISAFMATMAFSYAMAVQQMLVAVLPAPIYTEYLPTKIWIWPVLVTTTLFTAVGIGYGFYISHKTAGPLYRLKKTMQEIREGNTNLRLKFRPGDDFMEIADEFNSLMDSLKKN